MYKIHFDVNRPLVYELGVGAGLVSRVSLNLYFNISPIQLHNYYWICCRFKVTSSCKGEGDIWCDYNTVSAPFPSLISIIIVIDYCLWLKSLVCSANYVESSTFTLVYKIHFDANGPLVYEGGGGACLVCRVPLNLYFNISPIQLHNYWICCRL